MQFKYGGAKDEYDMMREAEDLSIDLIREG